MRVVLLMLNGCCSLRENNLSYSQRSLQMTRRLTNPRYVKPFWRHQYTKLPDPRKYIITWSKCNGIFSQMFLPIAVRKTIFFHHQLVVTSRRRHIFFCSSDFENENLKSKRGDLLYFIILPVPRATKLLKKPKISVPRVARVLQYSGLFEKHSRNLRWNFGLEECITSRSAIPKSAILLFPGSLDIWIY